MGRREAMIWLAALVALALVVAWLVERRWILTFRQELDNWGREATASTEGSET